MQYSAPSSFEEYKRLIRIIVTPVMTILPLYGLCLLICRVVSLLRIGLPDCGCPEAKKKLFSLKKKVMRLEYSLPPYDDCNECSPLISNRED